VGSTGGGTTILPDLSVDESLQAMSKADNETARDNFPSEEGWKREVIFKLRSFL
jgi:hypothetical protein